MFGLNILRYLYYIWPHKMSYHLLLKLSYFELKSQVLACGIAQDSTRCAGCRAVKRTDWTCPLFASSHLLIAAVEQSMKEEEKEEEEVVHLSERLLRELTGEL